jgi:hypothetical protein
LIIFMSNIGKLYYVSFCFVFYCQNLSFIFFTNKLFLFGYFNHLNAYFHLKANAHSNRRTYADGRMQTDGGKFRLHVIKCVNAHRHPSVCRRLHADVLESLRGRFSGRLYADVSYRACANLVYRKSR